MTGSIPLAAIDDTDRLRPIDQAHAEMIAASIEQVGLLQPIVLRRLEKSYKLVLGAHRFAALGMLGRERLEPHEYVLRDTDEVTARIEEIDENLARRELNALDRAIFLSERKKLHERREGASSHGGDRRSKTERVEDGIKSQTLRLGFSPRFTSEVADKVGLSERAIQLACRLADMLDADAIPLLRGTPLEANQSELLALAQMPAHDQRRVAQTIRDGRSKTVREARIGLGLDQPPPNDPEGRLFVQLLEGWQKASSQTRAAFLKEIGAAYVKKGDER